MDGTTLGINAAGNPALFDDDFLAMLGGGPVTTTLLDEVDDPDPEPGLSGSGATPTNDATPTEAIFDAELLGLTGDKRALNFIQCMRNAFEGQTDDIREQWQAAAEKLMNETIETACSSVQERRARMDKLYRTYVHYQDQNLPLSKFWEEATFRKYWTNFLMALITCSRGRDSERIRVVTFRQWCTDLMWLVGKNLVNTEGLRVGTKALTSGGLYARMGTVAARLCTQFDLNREPLPRLWIGHLELLLIYQAAIRISERFGRASVLQTILATSIVFQIGARIGSLGWSNRQYLDDGKYMKCGDVKVERMSYGVWDAEITVANRKGWNSAVDTTRPMTYRLTAVTKTHNLWFDTPSLLLLFLMYRGALEGCDSLADIFNYKGQFFIIKKEFRKKPLFLERTERGLDLKEDCPASANGMTYSFKVVGLEAGFTVTNFHGLRRDGATIFGFVLGAHAAQLALGHGEADSTYSVNYSKGVLSLPVSEARLGLLDHTLSLQQKIGIQRYRREGLAASALLYAGAKLLGPEAGEKPADGEPADAEAAADGEPESAPVENTPAEPVPEPTTTKKKGTRGNPIIALTEEQEEAEVQNDSEVRRLTRELNEYWDEIYPLFPPEAMERYGSRTADKVPQMRKKFKDASICKQNAKRIEELAEFIRATQQERTKETKKIRRKVRAQIKKERAAAERANPTVYTSEEMKKARKEVDAMAKVVNLPKPSEQIKALGAIRDMPHFGEGLLSEECRKILSSADVIEMLEQAETNEANEREDQLVNEKENETESIFKDVDDLKILDADLVKTKEVFLERVLEPLVVEKVYEQFAKDHNGEFPCLPCEVLPDEHRPRVVGNKLGQTRFKDRVGLHRHEDSVHTKWFDLIQYMLTDDPKLFKCPTQDCSFRAKTIDEVRDHCVTNCEECELYKSLERMHEQEQERKRLAVPSREKLRRTKDEHRLQGPGIQLRKNIFQGTEKISNTSPEEALQLAEERGISEEQVLPHLRGLAAMNERARTSIDQDGLIKDPNVKMPMERISKSLLTPELNADIDARLAKKK